MKSTGGCWRGWAAGPFVVAGSVVLAMSAILFSTHQIIALGPSGAARLPMLLDAAVEFPTARHHPPFRNITGKIMDEMARNGTGPCYDQHTNSTRVIGFPETDALVLETDVVHALWLQSYTSTGERRCAGGDYYELDLSSPLWKSRPPSEDLQNGTYAVQFMVPGAYAGDFNFTAVLLFDAYHGLDFNGETWSIKELTVSLRIRFVAKSREANSSSETDGQTLKRCDIRSGDFERNNWTGRWSRPVANDSCAATPEGRYLHCFASNVTCRNPTWCSGEPRALESMGWSYSAHCAFHIFEAHEAWDCLAGRWLFFWGDSNHQDTIRNLLTFVLGIEPPPGRDLQRFAIDRSYQNWVRNPRNVEQELRISSHYNGHPMVDNNGLGLRSLENGAYRRYVADFFRGRRYPDTVIMNSGLHDGWNQRSVESYNDTVGMAMRFWAEVVANLSGATAPDVVYRTTIAPAGASRGMQSNPQKLELFNRMVTEHVQAAFPHAAVVDAFDMSFPFHYDNRYSDGGHYGRPPSAPPHFYFVDLMLVHVLLNAVCPL